MTTNNHFTPYLIFASFLQVQPTLLDRTNDGNSDYIMKIGPETSEASGFIVDAERGLILTNRCVNNPFGLQFALSSLHGVS